MEILPMGEMIADQRYALRLNVNNHIAKMEDGWLSHPGASAIGRQLLDGDCSHGWQFLETEA